MVRHALAGGHEQAAGLRLKREDVPWFAERFEEHCRRHLDDEHLTPRLLIDAEVDFSAVTEGLLREFERLAPFGQGNRRPVLASRGVRVCGRPRRVGSAGRHLLLFLRQGDTTHRAVGFDMGDRLPLIERWGPVCDVAYRIAPDRYAGGRALQLVLCDIAPTDGG